MAASDPHNRFKAYLRLMIGIVILLVFMFGVGPWLERMPLFRSVVMVIEQRGIDASAYYYTDIEEFAEAEFNINQTMRFPPGIRPLKENR